MFDAWKARRQKMDARLDMWKADASRSWARWRHGEARAKLAWNRKERRLRQELQQNVRQVRTKSRA